MPPPFPVLDQHAGHLVGPEAELLPVEPDDARAARPDHLDLGPVAQAHLPEPMHQVPAPKTWPTQAFCPARSRGNGIRSAATSRQAAVLASFMVDLAKGRDALGRVGPSRDVAGAFAMPDRLRFSLNAPHYKKPGSVRSMGFRRRFDRRKFKSMS